MKIRLFCLLLFLWLPSSLAAGDFDRGVAAYNRGDLATALEEFRRAAAQRVAEAQLNLGVMYQNGQGVRQDHAEAMRWFRRAADQGNPPAQYNLGLAYLHGQGVLKNLVEAARWYRGAADQGYALAQNDLGVMYQNGQGVRQDHAEAVRWYRRAADQGNPPAENNLGWMYANGQGVPKSDNEAVRWYRKAADQGLAEGEYSLGGMYEHGQGVLKDAAEAVRWYRRAADQGYPPAQNNLGLMYENGQGVPKNYTEAVRWYRRAADQGLAVAQSNLGAMYINGTGVSRDNLRGYMWTSLAVAQGNEQARQNMQVVEPRLSRRKISEAQDLAATFVARQERHHVSWRGRLPAITQTRTSVASPAPVSPVERPPSVDRLKIAIPSETVRKIQSHLRGLGYDPGPIDGLIGPRTKQAIEVFKRKAGIQPDGVASSTLEALLGVLVEELRKRPTEPSQALAVKLSSTGTGFFVSRHGKLLTNQHVVEDCAQIRVALPAGSLDAKLLGSNSDDDLALLHVDFAPEAVAAFRRTPAALGEDVIVVGYPLRGVLGGINVTTGSVSAMAGLRTDRRYFQITAPVQRGNSGGPLLDNTGAVVGVVVGKLDALAIAGETGDIPQNVNFAIKGAVARSFLSIYDVAYEESAVREEPGRVAIAAQAQKHTFVVECWK